MTVLLTACIIDLLIGFPTPSSPSSLKPQSTMAVSASRWLMMGLLSCIIVSALCVELQTAEFLAGLNSGGLTYALSDGRSFENDANSFSGTAPDETYSNPNGAFSTNPLSGAESGLLPLYNSHRVVKQPFDIVVTLDVPDNATQTIIVRLFFAEVFPGGRSVGYRVFDVLLNGNVVLPNLDIFASAPANNGIFYDFAVTGATSISVSFARKTRQPIISGVALYNSPVRGGEMCGLRAQTS